MLTNNYQYKLKDKPDEQYTIGGLLDHINCLWRTDEKEDGNYIII